MKKAKIAKRFLIETLILLLVFTPISLSEIFSGEYFKVKAYEDEIISGYQEWADSREIDGSVLIGSEATLVIKKGITVTFKEGSSLNVEGKLFVKGTRNDPVKFRREGIEEIAFDENEEYPEEYSGYQIYIQGEADFNNADISGGGSFFNVYLKGKDIINRIYALGESSAISVTDEAKLKMRNCYVHGNMGGIELNGVNGRNIKVHKTLFERNKSYDVANVYSWGYEAPDFRYNWWRNSDGPEKIDPSLNIYKYINGNINFSNWLATKDFKDPVIIIPGILGSEKKDGQWQIDPVFHTYDNLYEEFIQNGYLPNKDLFTFPYEWRNSNVGNARLLRNKIIEIKNAENWPEVDIVAHSMGGLLAREYAESDYYDDDIDQLIMLGTPNNGAPEAYLKWEAGAFFTSLQDVFIKYYFKHEAKENGYTDLFYYIQDKVLSVKELLPVYGYLYDVENNENLLEYPANYPFNDFLDSLNNQIKKEKLLQIELDKVIGNVNDPASTIAGFKVIKTDMGDYWEHGYPHGFEIPLIGDGGIINGYGDRTVPLESAKSENIFTDEIIELNSSHRELPTNAQREIIKMLTGVEPTSEVESNLIRDILFVSVYSPIDIQVEAPDGEIVGKNFLTGEIINEIEGAYYTGAGAENEFLTIPNPIDGKYKIRTQGTGSGEYTIEAAKITENPTTGTANESAVEITGNAISGQEQEEEKEIKVEGNNVTAGTHDTLAPEISITSPEEDRTYFNNQILAIIYAISDNVSQNIPAQVFLDGNNFSKQNIDLSLQNLGEHRLKVIAVDEAGNSAEKEAGFRTETNIGALLENVNHYAALNLIKNENDKKVLISRLKLIREIEKLIKLIENSHFFKNKVKERLIKGLKEQSNGQLDWLAQYVNQRSKTGASDGIDPKIGSLLMESLNFLKYN